MGSVSALVAIAIQILTPVVVFTSTKIDDAILAVLKAIAGSPDLLNLLQSLLSNEKIVAASANALENKGAFSHAVMDECHAFAAENPNVMEAGNASGIAWLSLISVMPGVVQTIMQLINAFKKPPVPTPAVASTDEASAAAASA